MFFNIDPDKRQEAASAAGWTEESFGHLADKRDEAADAAEGFDAGASSSKYFQNQDVRFST